MAIPPRAKPLVTRLLTSESFEKLKKQTARAVESLGGRNATLRFFHDPGCARSWLMTQALIDLQSHYDVSILGHTIAGPDPDIIRNPHQYRRFSWRDALHQAAYHGLLAPERQPHFGEVEEVSAELFRLEGTSDWLLHARHLGEQLFRGNSLVGAATDLSPLERNMTLLRQLGSYRGGTVFTHGEWFFGVDRMLLIEELMLDSSEAKRLVTQAPSRDLPPIDGDTLRFFFSFRSPFSFLALPRVVALATRYQLKLETYPVLAPQDERRATPVRLQLDMLLDASREARRRRISFGRVAPLSEDAHRELACIYYGLADDEERQQHFLHNAFHALWVRGLNFNLPHNFERLLAESAIRPEEAEAFLQQPEWLEQAHDNGEELMDWGYLDVPAFEIGTQRYWGYDRLNYLEEQLAGRS